MPVQLIKKIVAYYRLSKPKKGKNKNETIRDAYGLEDQRREVARFAEEHGATIIAEFCEIETGRRADRPELKKALLMAQMHKATLVIGKQDRLGRNVAFVANLAKSGVDFVCVDRPNQSKFEMHIRASVDEDEADRISERTKRGLRVAKEKGVKLGSARPGHWKGREHLRRKALHQATAASSQARTQRTKEAYRHLIDFMADLNAQGVPLDVIAARLNELGHVTTAGQPFHKFIVHHTLKLFGIKPHPARRVAVNCSGCGRELKVSWARREAHKVSGDPIVCFRCVKKKVPA